MMEVTEIQGGCCGDKRRQHHCGGGAGHRGRRGDGRRCAEPIGRFGSRASRHLGHPHRVHPRLRGQCGGHGQYLVVPLPCGPAGRRGLPHSVPHLRGPARLHWRDRGDGLRPRHGHRPHGRFRARHGDARRAAWRAHRQDHRANSHAGVARLGHRVCRGAGLGLPLPVLGDDRRAYGPNRYGRLLRSHGVGLR